MTADRPTASPSLDELSRRALADDAGTTYLAYRSSLQARWGRLWLQLAAGYVALAAVGLGIVTLAGGGAPADVALALGGGIGFGYALHYLVLFQHEAAHFNLARTRAGNDRLCNVAIGLLIGEDIRSYRRVHLAHHRHLGTPADTERSYFESLDRRWLAECLSGIRPVRVVLARARLSEGADTAASDRDADEAEAAGSFVGPVTLGAVVVNGTIVLGAVVLGVLPLAAAWVLGLVVFWPLFNSGRQILEHRGFEADRSIDYATVPHGAVNRLFGSGVLASTLGGAGFNRHLLHHWDPGVSCTRLADLEAFLAGTEARPALDGARATYLGTWRRLWSR